MENAKPRTANPNQETILAATRFESYGSPRSHRVTQ